MERISYASRRESNMSNSTVDSGYAGSVIGNGNSSQGEGNSGIQMYGFMQKKPFGHQSTKWSKRFFVLKEGFLFYYAESEKKAFETKKYFNIHPKGIVPLGYCTIEDATFPGMPHCINICHPEFKSPICVATEDEELRKEWIRALDKASKVTVENLELSETMIKSLQEQNLQLARERQEYVDKYINEAEEAGAQKDLVEALEEFNKELEDENARIEGLVEELRHDHNKVKNELVKAIDSSKKLEKEREEMAVKTHELQRNMEILSNERSAIIEKLQDHEAKNTGTAEQNAALARQLAAIEQKAQGLEKDREQIRQRLEENERKSQEILLEKEMFSQEAEELKCEMEVLSVEKELAKRELQDEILARVELEKELNECKAALKRLETKALGRLNEDNSDASSVSDTEESTDEQLIKDVKSLREFFETVARENKPIPPPRLNSKGSSDNKKADEPAKSPGSSPARMAAVRASRIQRRRNTARCKSMVINDDTAAALLREPSYRRSVMLDRHRRSMSLTGRKEKKAVQA